MSSRSRPGKKSRNKGQSSVPVHLYTRYNRGEPMHSTASNYMPSLLHSDIFVLCIEHFLLFFLLKGTHNYSASLYTRSNRGKLVRCTTSIIQGHWIYFPKFLLSKNKLFMFSVEGQLIVVLVTSLYIITKPMRFADYIYQLYAAPDLVCLCVEKYHILR